VDGAGDFAGHGFDIRKIGLAPFGGRGADGDEDNRAGADGFMQIVGKSEAVAAVAAEQLGQKFFVDGDLAVLERG